MVQSLKFNAEVPVSTTDSISKGSTSPSVIAGTDSVSSASTTPYSISPVFLSYRIFGQSKEMIRDTFDEYFKNLGWQMNARNDMQSIVFFSSAGQPLFVTFIDSASTSETDAQTIVVTVSTQ